MSYSWAPRFTAGPGRERVVPFPCTPFPWGIFKEVGRGAGEPESWVKDRVSPTLDAPEASEQSRWI